MKCIRLPILNIVEQIVSILREKVEFSIRFFYFGKLFLFSNGYDAHNLSGIQIFPINTNNSIIYDI